jgi:hypothetical protein
MAKSKKQYEIAKGLNIPWGDGEQRFEAGDEMPDLKPEVLKKLIEAGAVREIDENG